MEQKYNAHFVAHHYILVTSCVGLHVFVLKKQFSHVVFRLCLKFSESLRSFKIFYMRENLYNTERKDNETGKNG